MAIVPRNTKKGTVYWVVTRKHFERVGMNKREAERLDAQRKKEVKAGTYVPSTTGAVTVRTFLTSWGESRTNRSGDGERMMLRVHVLSRAWLADMKMEDVRPKHSERLAKELVASINKPKYAHNVFAAYRTAMRAAVREEVIDRDVTLIAPGILSKKSAPKVPYTTEEAAALLGSATHARRVWLALALYTGMRCGEVCGRRWRHLDGRATPLACLTIDTQYNDQPLKTDTLDVSRPRKAPVHPELAKILAEWWATGFEAYYLRKPKIDDFIVPAYPALTRPLTRSAAYKAMGRDCVTAGVRKLGQHATRHTFLSLAQRGGAVQTVIELVTHNAKGTMVDQYTHRQWDELCAAVRCLPPYGIVDSPVDPTSATPENKGVDGSDSRTRTGRKTREAAESTQTSGSAGHARKPKSPKGAADDAVLDASQHSEEAFLDALREHTSDSLRGVRPVAKTKPAGYVARKRAAGGGK